ncbi:CGNR zinc finger domain-containing protein [Streptomyces sp. NBC_00076]|uniref:CGNR zinc finger domain-containing protein n=1 Tax=Streptomyces sp. NBC_00076 TaxID=2975642 RepID=UPI0032479071
MSERSPAPGGLALVQSLVNTLDIESYADSLDGVEGRARFGIAENELEGARELRESLRAALLAHAGHPPHRTVNPLGELLARAPLVLTVDPADGSAALVPADGSPALVRGDGSASLAPGDGSAALARAVEVPLLSRVAAAVAQALVEGTWTRLKACEAADCHWAYYDRSPAGRGRWCSMQVCGARAKMRRYRAKA